MFFKKGLIFFKLSLNFFKGNNIVVVQNYLKA